MARTSLSQLNGGVWFGLLQHVRGWGLAFYGDYDNFAALLEAVSSVAVENCYIVNASQIRIG